MLAKSDHLWTITIRVIPIGKWVTTCPRDRIYPPSTGSVYKCIKTLEAGCLDPQGVESPLLDCSSCWDLFSSSSNNGRNCVVGTVEESFFPDTTAECFLLLLSQLPSSSGSLGMASWWGAFNVHKLQSQHLWVAKFLCWALALGKRILFIYTEMYLFTETKDHLSFLHIQWCPTCIPSLLSGEKGSLAKEHLVKILEKLKQWPMPVKEYLWVRRCTYINFANL